MAFRTETGPALSSRTSLEGGVEVSLDEFLSGHGSLQERPLREPLGLRLARYFLDSALIIGATIAIIQAAKQNPQVIFSTFAR